MIRRALAVGVLSLGAIACNWLTGASDLSVGDSQGQGTGTSSGGPTTLSSSGTPVFFLQWSGGDQPTGSAGFVSSRGGMPRTVGCASPSLAELFGRVSDTGETETSSGPYRYASFLTRAFEGSSGSPSVFIYPGLDPGVDESSMTLVAATSDTDCAGRPPVALSSPNPSGNVLAILPRVSPNGRRVAYLETATELQLTALVTVGIDGTDRRVVRRIGGAKGTGLWGTPPAWVTNDELMWTEAVAQEQPLLKPPVSIHRGPDRSASEPASTSSCNLWLEQLEVFQRDGATFVASVSSPSSWQQGQGNSNLRVRGLDEPCEAGKALTDDATAGNAARDIAVSPDGRLIAFAWNAQSGAGPRSLDSPMHVWLVDSAGLSPPIACSALEGNSDEFGPRWIEGGAKLVFTRSTRDVTHESIHIADIDGGKCVNVRPLLEDGTTRFIGPANASMACSMSSPAHATIPLVGAFAVMIAMLARRRRRMSQSAHSAAPLASH